jgi:sugar lactone lactonase YvrE
MTFKKYVDVRLKLVLLFVLAIHPFCFAQRVTTVAGGSGDGGPALSADLFGPSTVAVDGIGNIFIADAASRTIRRVDYQTGTITSVAGNGMTGSAGDGGLAISASLGNPSGVALDVNGNIYISDQLSSVIRKIDIATGMISRIAGDPGSSSGFTGDNGPAIAAKLSSPHALTVDANGNIYFTDTGNQRIRKINAATGLITTIAGNGSYGYTGDNGLATAAEFSNPNSVAVDANGNIYIADYGNSCVRRINSTSGIVTTVAGTGTTGFSGDGGLATQALLNSPSGVLIGADGNLIISDTYNQRIRKVDLSTGIITTIAGSGTFGFHDDAALLAQLNVPQGLAKDAAGNIFFSEYVNRRIRKITGTTVTTVAGNGGFDGEGGLATDASLNGPRGVALDADGNIFITDSFNDRIRKVDKSTGNISTVAGDGAHEYSGDGGLATNAGLNWPTGIIFDKDGNLFFTDAGNHVVRKIEKTSGLITTVAGNGSNGFGGDLGPATNASFTNPTGLAFDSLGNLFIADQYANKIRRVDATTGIITTFAGNGTSGSDGDGGPAVNAQLNNPTKISFGSKGNLLIVDSYNNKIRMVNATTAVISTVVNSTDIDQLLSPSDVIVQGDELYVLEAFRIKIINQSTGVRTVIAGSTDGYFGDGGAAVDGQFKFMTNFVRDPAGNLFIADTENNRIRKITARVSQTLSFDPLTPRTYGDPPFDLTATASSGLPVSFTSSDINIADVSGKTVTIHSGGTITITAIQPGDLDFLPSSPASQALSINKANQSVTFGAIASKTLGGPSFDPNASASSGLDITYSTSSDKVAISGKQVSLVKAGRLTITADQAGNANFLAALPVEQNFCINPAKPVITLTPSSAGVILSSSNDNGNQWFLNGGLISGATEKTLTAQQIGIYSVQSAADDCPSTLSDDLVLSITAIQKDLGLNVLQFFPNPVYESLNVKVMSIDSEQLLLEIFDPLGRNILTRTGTTNEEVSLDVKELNPGIYFIKAMHGPDQCVERFLKK